MIYNYSYADVGNENVFRRMKFSIAYLAKMKQHSDSKVIVNYIRGMGKNPSQNLAALDWGKKIGIIDEVFLEYFNPENGLDINRGFPLCDLSMYLSQCKRNEEPTLHITPDIFICKEVELDQDAIYFYEKDNVWWGVPWGYVTETHAQEFLSFANSKGFAQQVDINQYEMYRASFVYIPKQFADEFHHAMTEMIKWTQNFYKDDEALFLSCACMQQIALSILSIDKQNQGVKIKLITEDEKNRKSIIRYKAEEESDIAGSAKVFFDGVI